MNIHNTQFHITVVALLLLTCAAVSAEDKGAELLQPFKVQLKQALIEGLKEGPVSAISVCRIEAPEIAASLSVDGSTVGRSSQRLRNPKNVAPDWVREVLDNYVADPATRTPQRVQLQGDRQGYVEPIMMAPLCLACHGESIADDVKVKIDELYPQDEATGFALDDLRGVFWVEYSRALADEG